MTELGGIMLRLSPTAAMVIAKQTRPSTNTRTNKRMSSAAAYGFAYSFHDSSTVIPENYNMKPRWRLKLADLRDSVSWW